MSRVSQFFKDVFSPLFHLDQAIFRQYLTEPEIRYIQRLRRAERLHVIQVTKKTGAGLPRGLSEPERSAIMKAVLLHDVGKYHYAMGPVAKTGMVLFGRWLSQNPDNLKKYNRLDVYLHHAHYSWELVMALGSFPEYPYLYDLIRFHHEPERFVKKYGKKEQTIFWIYKKADDES